jgi:hypothetical protein
MLVIYLNVNKFFIALIPKTPVCPICYFRCDRKSLSEKFYQCFFISLFPVLF